MNKQQKKRYDTIKSLTVLDDSKYPYPGGACVVIAICMALPHVNIREIFAKFCVLNTDSTETDDLREEIENNIIKFDGTDEHIIMKVLEDLDEHDNVALLKYSGSNRITVKQFCKRYPKTTAYLGVTGHAICVINGTQMQDNHASEYYDNKKVHTVILFNPNLLDKDFINNNKEFFVECHKTIEGDNMIEYENDKGHVKKKTIKNKTPTKLKTKPKAKAKTKNKHKIKPRIKKKKKVKKNK